MGFDGLNEFLKGLGTLLALKPVADLFTSIWLWVHPQSCRNLLLLKSQLRHDRALVESGKFSYDSKTQELIPGPHDQAQGNSQGQGQSEVREVVTTQDPKDPSTASTNPATAVTGEQLGGVEDNLKDIAGRMVLGNSLNFIAALVAAALVAQREGITAQQVQQAYGTVEREFLNDWAQRSMLIENESRRELWGKLLIEQIKAKEPLSVRTLRVFSGLSAEEKLLFERLTPYVFAHRLLLAPTNAGDPDFNFGHIHELVDAGLLLSNTTSTCELWPSQKELGFEYQKGGCLGFCLYNSEQHLLRFSINPGEDLWRDDFLEGYALTKAGIELLKLSPKPLSKAKLQILAQGLCPSGRELRVDVIATKEQSNLKELLEAPVIGDLSVITHNDRTVFSWLMGKGQ